MEESVNMETDVSSLRSPYLVYVMASSPNWRGVLSDKRRGVY